MPARTRTGPDTKIPASLYQWQEGLRTYLLDNYFPLPFLCQEISSTIGSSWEHSKIISFFPRAAPNKKLSPVLLTSSMHISLNYFTHACASNTRKRKMQLERTHTQAWLCWGRGWQHKSKNTFSLSLKNIFLSWPAVYSAQKSHWV